MLLAAALVLVACGGGSTTSDTGDTTSSTTTTTTQPPRPAALLVFTRTEGFRHASIPAAVEAVTGIAQASDMTVEVTEDSAAFTDDNLARFGAVVFLLTTGDVLDREQELALERYVAAGGGFAGVHSASDTEYDWAFYGELVGAYFARHPAVQPATVVVDDHDHPSTAEVPSLWQRTDEWYDHRQPPPAGVRVLASVDEATYDGGGMGDDHPIVWAHERLGGRAWYTAMGHTVESYAEPEFLAHLRGGILWAAGQLP